MRVYPEYKDSGVEWLGEIPVHWNICPLKRTIYVAGGFAFSSDSFSDAGTPIIRIGDINQDGSVSLAGCKRIAVLSDDGYKKYRVVKGDLLMAMTGATIGKAGWYSSDEKALLNQRVGVFKLKHKEFSYRFLWYLLSSKGYQEYIKLVAFGGAQPNISDTAMVDYLSGIPPFEEQKNIAIHLDRETARIDKLITEKQNFIKLLKEKRQALISHVVTKGLDPDVKMKESGIEWIGEVPEHWEVKAISKISRKITNGYVGPTKDILIKSGVPYIQATHIKGGGIKFDNKYFVSQEWSNKKRKSILKENDVLIVQTGAGTGDVGFVTKNEEGFNCHALIIVQSIHEHISGKYLSLMLLSTYGASILYSIRTGGMHPHLNCSNVKFIKVPVAPLREQKKIEKYIKEKTDAIKRLSSETAKSITLLKEHRTALISAAVTGKIDVRNQAKESAA